MRKCTLLKPALLQAAARYVREKNKRTANNDLQNGKQAARVPYKRPNEKQK